MKDLVGRTVRIQWKDPDSDWEFFHLLSYDKPLLHLKGVYDPIQKCNHQGDSFYCHVDEVRQIAGYL